MDTSERNYNRAFIIVFILMFILGLAMYGCESKVNNCMNDLVVVIAIYQNTFDCTYHVTYPCYYGGYWIDDTCGKWEVGEYLPDEYVEKIRTESFS